MLLDFSSLIKSNFIDNIKPNICNDNIKPNICNSGIYVWGFVKDEKFLPYYVGQANKLYIYDRLRSHYYDLGVKRYTLFKQVNLFSFKNYLRRNVSKNSLNPIYRDNRNVLVYYNITKGKGKIDRNEHIKFPEIGSAANFYRDNFYFKYCIVKQNPSETQTDFSRKLNYIEAAIKYWLDDHDFPTIGDCKLSSKTVGKQTNKYSPVNPVNLI